LIDSGADVNTADKQRNGHTLLMHAIIHENISALEKLLERGADWNARNHSQKTPLTLALNHRAYLIKNQYDTQNIERIIEILKAKGAKETSVLDSLNLDLLWSFLSPVFNLLKTIWEECFLLRSFAPNRELALRTDLQSSKTATAQNDGKKIGTKENTICNRSSTAVDPSVSSCDLQSSTVSLKPQGS